MSWKQLVNIQLPEGNKLDAFDASDKLRRLPGILGANAVTAQEVRVKYDNRKTDEQQIRTAVLDKAKTVKMKHPTAKQKKRA